MTPDELLAEARTRPNPFSGHVLADGYQSPPEDLPQIHREERERILRLVAQVRTARTPRLVVLIGDPGEGKTHMLAALRREADESWRRRGSEYALVAVQPVVDVDEPFRHLLGETVAGLARPLFPNAAWGTPNSVLDHLIWRALRRVIAEIPRGLDRQADGALAELRRYSGAQPGAFAVDARELWPLVEETVAEGGPRLPWFAERRLNAAVWRVLCRFPNGGLDQLVRRWLEGEGLIDAELARLRVRTPVEGEKAAFDVLSNLLNLFEVPVVLGLDQLEAVRRLGEHAVPKLFQALAQLYTRGGSFIGLVCAQTTAWADFAPRLEEQLRDRLEPELKLRRLDAPLASQLVARRLAGMWAGIGTPPSPTFPFSEGEIGSVCTSRLTPRQVLRLFADKWERLGTDEPTATEPTSDAVPTAAEFARRKFHEAFATARERERLDPEARRDRVELGLVGVLEGASGGVVDGTYVTSFTAEAKVPGRRARALRAKVARDGRERRIYAEVSNAVHGKSTSATVDRLSEALSNGHDRALWLREEGLALPRAASAKLDALGDRARVVRLTPDDVVALDSVNELLAAVLEEHVDETAAMRTVLDELLPPSGVLRKIFDAAFDPPAHGTVGADVEAVVRAFVAAPPGLAAEARIAAASSLPLEQIVEASDRLEANGEAFAVDTRSGGRVVVRRPR